MYSPGNDHISSYHIPAGTSLAGKKAPTLGVALAAFGEENPKTLDDPWGGLKDFRKKTITVKTRCLDMYIVHVPIHIPIYTHHIHIHYHFKRNCDFSQFFRELIPIFVDPLTGDLPWSHR